MRNPGIVYIVGAGPGDPELITVRGLNCLRQAGVVVYDRLANPRLLDEAPLSARLIDAGKAPGRHPLSQEAINDRLIAEARQGHVVVRLKGGDPFLFGRGGEECQALAGAGISFEVVPGVSSALAVPAYAGIPVTHRGLAGAVTIVTGHTAGAAGCVVDWASLPAGGTLVILMGLRHLATIVQQLLAHGRPPYTPVAVIQSGTTAGQVVVEGTLAGIVEQARGIQSPAIIVVGEVVRLRRQLAWFDPLMIRVTLNSRHSSALRYSRFSEIA
ncbi:MAG: uroporphyrinogen-III C-methyltransferase [Chloroflexi bacterium]|nr:uroporphyrinogen-III C-methyltransferase [Chloroflexota bacterium]MCI0579509.1 uroporphyrinogen-III C-methyltransferase [Chloroflexota bacterium]MCI0647279.1 uroporphyrinogen-III C-methyltransferase [Chloroflexota bacterium]MCI0729318.1 uroporphyrinogen-III C-methyltransferase [Chloroflexota bacterium]